MGWHQSREPLTKSDVPTSLSHRSSHTEFEHQKLEPTNPSSIAADGGFGPMRPAADGKDNREEEDEDAHGDFGDDFDEFEAGGEVDDDFGDFDEGLEEPSKETQRPPPAPDIPFVSGDNLFNRSYLSQAVRLRCSA